MGKRKKKHWTTKNTHIQRKKRVKEWKPKESKIENIAAIIILILTIISTILVSLNSRIVLYDYFPSIPSVWIKFLSE